MKIQAAVAWEAGGTLSIEELDLDDPRDDEILVRVEACGVCHTDDNARLGRMPVVFPIILGHEGAGVVERVGGDVTRVRPGDRVLFTPDYCGRSRPCPRPRPSPRRPARGCGPGCATSSGCRADPFAGTHSPVT